MENKLLAKIETPSALIGFDVTNLTTADGVSECRQRTAINETSTLELTVSPNIKSNKLHSPEATCISNGRQYFLWGENCLSRERGQDDSLTETFVLKEQWYELADVYVTAHNITFPTTDIHDIALFMVMLHGNSEDQLVINEKDVTIPHEVGTAKYLVSAMLYGTGWSIDESVDYWSEGKIDLESEKKSVLENLMLIQEQFGGMLIWDSLSKTVALVDENKQLESASVKFRIRYRSNLLGIQRIENRDVATVVYPYGNNYLNIAEVNDGKEYLEDYSYTKRKVEKIVINNDIYSQSGLLEWGKDRLKHFSKPRHSYEVDLVYFVNAYGKEPKIGDIVEVFDEDVTVESQILRVTEIDRSLLETEDCKIIVGDPRSSFEGKLISLFYDNGIIRHMVDSRNNLWSRNMNRIQQSANEGVEGVEHLEQTTSELKKATSEHSLSITELTRRIEALEQQRAGGV